jgi:succinate dehydrogenase / fumarate reductase membrane anchor subunit
MVNREVVGAHYGLRDWLAQRVTAVVMVLYTVLLIALVLLSRSPQLDHDAWRALFAPQWMKLASLVFMLCIFMHAWVGMRNIFMDYVKSVSVRLVLYSITLAWLIVCTGWAVRILWSV